MKVSKDVKKMRYYESTLLTVYKVCAPIHFHLHMESSSDNGNWNEVLQ